MVNETSDRRRLTPKASRTRARIVEQVAALIHEREVAGAPARKTSRWRGEPAALLAIRELIQPTLTGRASWTWTGPLKVT